MHCKYSSSPIIKIVFTTVFGEMLGVKLNVAKINGSKNSQKKNRKHLKKGPRGLENTAINIQNDSEPFTAEVQEVVLVDGFAHRIQYPVVDNNRYWHSAVVVVAAAAAAAEIEAEGLALPVP